MNILYLHGLDGSLSDAKRSLLENYGSVYAPQIAYRKHTTCMQRVYEAFKNHKIDRVIGSSMGGFMAYYLADALNCKALLFNPALAARPVVQEVIAPGLQTTQTKTFFLGAEDTVVPPQQTLKFLSERPFNSNHHINILKGLAHRIPVPVFETALQQFFQ